MPLIGSDNVIYQESKDSAPWGPIAVWVGLCAFLVGAASVLGEPWRTPLIAISMPVFLILVLIVMYLTVRRPAGAIWRLLSRLVVTLPMWFIGMIGSIYMKVGLYLIEPILDYGYRTGKYQRLTNPATVPRVKSTIFDEPFSDVSFKSLWATHGSVQLDHATSYPSPSLYLGANPLGAYKEARESSAFFTKVKDLPNGEIEVEAALGSEGSLEILFRLQNDLEAGYAARVSTEAGTFARLLKRASGKEVDITRVSEHPRSGFYPRAISVQFIDDVMALYLDGEVVATAIDREFSHGRIGLKANSSSKWVHRFTVRSIC